MDTERIDQARSDANEMCPVCRGTDGHHHLHCPNMGKEKEKPHVNDPSLPDDHSKLGTEEMESYVDAEFDEHKVPPNANDIVSSDFLWLVAKVCHEVNRAYCREVMADHTHLSWEETSPELRASIYDGVVKHFENPDLTPEDSHRAWCEYKVAEGWQFGNRKDVEAKTHPCLLPYDQLHAHDRAKDHLFASVCKSLFGGSV